MNNFIFESSSEEQTRQLGAALAQVLPDATVIALQGTLGAGKTRLVQVVAAASGVNVKNVVSPTFVLVHEYHGARSIYHFDVYRIRDDDEFLELGPDEYFEGTGLTFVEWSDRVERCLPPEYVLILVDILGDTQRQFTVTPIGERFQSIVEQLQAFLAEKPVL